MAAPVLLEAAAIEAALAASLPGWRLAADGLRRDWRTRDWSAPLMVANAIAQLAESAWHHPEMTLSYDRVGVCLSTHESGGVTARDLELARRIDQVLDWPVEPGQALTGAPPAQRLLRDGPRG